MPKKSKDQLGFGFGDAPSQKPLDLNLPASVVVSNQLGLALGSTPGVAMTKESLAAEIAKHTRPVKPQTRHIPNAELTFPALVGDGAQQAEAIRQSGISALVDMLPDLSGSSGAKARELMAWSQRETSTEAWVAQKQRWGSLVYLAGHLGDRRLGHKGAGTISTAQAAGEVVGDLRNAYADRMTGIPAAEPLSAPLPYAENAAQALAHIRRGGVAVLRTMTRVTYIDRKTLERWERSGHQLLKDRAGEPGWIMMATGKKWVVLWPGSLKLETQKPTR